MGVLKDIIKYGVYNLGTTKHRYGSSHVLRDTYSASVLSDIYDFLHFRNSDHGSTKKYIDAYSRNGLVYMVVNKVSSNAAGLPREYRDANGEVIENSEIERLLKRPNSYQSETEFRQQLNEYLSLSGNGFILNTTGVGAGNELEVLDSSKMTILIDSQGELSGYRYIDNVGKRIKYDVEDILHIKLSNSLETEREMKFWGLSPLRALWSVVSASDDLFTARAAIWKNKGYAGILTNKSDTPLLPKERNDLQDSFNDEIGGADRANGVRVSTGNLSYLQLGMSPQDLQLLEGNIDNLRMISASYKTSSILYNDVANSTYNNVLESKRDAYTDAYIPLDEKVNEKLGPWLSDILGVEETIVVDTTRIEVLKLTTNEVANRLNNLPTNVAARVMEAVTINESRDLIGLDTIDKGEEMLGKSNNKEDEKSPK